MNCSIHVLKMAEVEVPGPEVFWMSHWNAWETLFFQMVVVRCEGRTVVINTGPPPDLTALNQAWGRFAGPRCQIKRTEGEQPLNALARLQVAPEKVDYVLLTPLQAYATSNLALFPNAQFCFSRRGWIDDVMAPLPHLHVPRPLCVPDEVLKYLIFDAWDRVRLLEDEEEEIFPGVRSWWAGTHHRSSMIYEIDSPAGKVMIGDCAFKYENLEGHPLGIAESIIECERVYRRIRKEADIFVPLYDPSIQTRFPEGRVV